MYCGVSPHTVRRGGHVALDELHKKARKALEGTLASDEQVLLAEPGENAALVATDRRVIVLKWGATSGAMFGAQTNSWDYTHITGIESRKGMTTAAVVVQTAGANVVSKFGRMDNGANSVWEAPNALFLKDKAVAEAAAGTLRQLLASHRPGAAPVSAPATDPVEEIRRYAALRDEGLISEDEFQAKKAALLS
jgi:hypothetical protein